MNDWIFDFVKKYQKNIIIVCVAIFALDILLVANIISISKNSEKTEFDFLNVGQGDSELVRFSGNGGSARTKLLIDGGPENGMVLTALSSLLSPTDRYIDLVVMTHAQADHIGGLIEVVKRYRVGAFLWTGRVNNTSAFRELMDVVRNARVKIITLRQGDTIKNGTSNVAVLSPNDSLANDKDLNNSSLVLRVSSNRVSALFPGDVAKKAEAYLARNVLSDVDIIKVPHHGSKTSLIREFLNAVSPKIAVFEVGKNSYGHPTEEALNNYAELGAKLFRTDKNGTIRLMVGEDRNITVTKN